MFDTDVVVMDQPSLLIGVGIAAAGAGSDFWRPRRSEVPLLCPISFGAHPRELIHYVLEYKGQWWTHKGSNLGPLPCEKPPHHRDGFW
jgi:hypothetical protein